jgi:hypothetical protein
MLSADHRRERLIALDADRVTGRASTAKIQLYFKK